MKKAIFKGVGTAIVTPFDAHGNINYKEFKRLIELQIKNGVSAIIVCGTTGEAATLTKEEKQEVIRCCVKVVDKRIPVIAGIGSNNTKEVVENEKYAEQVGVDGLLVVTPYYNKTTQVGLLAHFKQVASQTSLPIILYNVPSRTGMNILPSTYQELSHINNIVATKEANGDIASMIKTKHLCGDELQIYSGNDDLIVPTLSVGGMGVISVLSNVLPKYTSTMVQHYFKGNIQQATKMQLDIIDFVNLLFKEVNPIPVKAALNFLGYDVGKPRLPLLEASRDLKNEVRNQLNILGQ